MLTMVALEHMPKLVELLRAVTDEAEPVDGHFRVEFTPEVIEYLRDLRGKIEPSYAAGAITTTTPRKR